MISTLQQWDADLLLWFNQFHSPGWDQFMSLATGRWFSIPVYLALLVWVIWKFRKKALIVLPVIALLVVSSDQLSRACKYGFKRERPCYNITIQDKLHVYDGCGGRYGFVSSHAANTFALALFMFLLSKGTKRRGLFALLFIWAAFMVYTRIYLGVHYPLDIVCGALLGMGCAYGWWKLYETRLKQRFFN